MQQQMGGPVCQVITGLPPRLRAAAGISLSTGAHGHRHRVVMVRTGGRASLGRVETSHELFVQNARSSGNTASNRQHQLIPIGKDKFFEIEMEVRDDELDEYGVVNNAIYASYLHSGRDVMLEKMGISVNYWTSTGKAMALSELNLKYFAPLKSGDRFVVKVKAVQIKGVRIVLEHIIEGQPDRKLVLEGRATAVCLNKDFRPTRVFPELSASLIEVFSCKVA